MSSKQNNTLLDMMGIGDSYRMIFAFFIFCFLFILYIIAPLFFGAHNIDNKNSYEYNFNANKGFCLIRFNYDKYKNNIPKPNKLVDIFKLSHEKQKTEELNDPQSVTELDSQYFYDYSKYLEDNNGEKIKDKSYTATNEQMTLDYARDSDLLYVYHLITNIILKPFDIIIDLTLEIVKFLEVYVGDVIQEKYADLIFGMMFFILLTINLMEFFQDFKMSIKNFIVNMFTGLSYIIIGYYMLKNNIMSYLLKIVLIFQHYIITQGSDTVTMDTNTTNIISDILSKISNIMNFILHYDTFFGVLTITYYIRIIYIALFAICMTNLMSCNMYYIGLLVLCYAFSPIIPIFIGCYSILPLKFNVLISFYLNFTITVSLAISLISILFDIIAGVLHFSLPLSICYVNGILHGFSYWYMYDTDLVIMPKHLYFFVVATLIFMIYNRCSDEITKIFEMLFNTQGAIMKLDNLFFPSSSLSSLSQIMKKILAKDDEDDKGDKGDSKIQKK